MKKNGTPSLTPLSAFNLWPHQIDALDATMADWAGDCPDALVSIPTGCGKTRFFCALATLVWKPGKRILVIAHTEELIDQPYAVFEEFFSPIHPQAKLGIVRAKRRDYKADVIFATVQTISQNGWQPLYEILHHGQVDILIVDETHHIVADTYTGTKERIKSKLGWDRGFEELQAIQDWLYDTFDQEMKEAGSDEECKRALIMHREKLEERYEKWSWMLKKFDLPPVHPNLLTLGVTATAYRTDNISLGNCFPRVLERDRFTYVLTIRQAITQKLLCPFKPAVLHTNLSATTTQLTHLWEAGNWAELLKDKWLELCGGQPQPTVFFAPNVETSKSMCKYLGEHGITAGHIDGEVCYLWDGEALARIERKTLLEKFRAKEFFFLGNFGVLTEGVDFPFMRCLIIARPTQSRTVYVQMLGRVLRLDKDDPDKEALVLHVGFEGMALVDYTSITGEMLNEEMEAIEKAFKLLSVDGHASNPPPCPSCQGPLRRIRGTRDYQCELCQNMFTGGKDIEDHIPDILDPTKPSGRGTYVKYLQLFVEDVVAWYTEGPYWSVSIGVGGRNGDEAERTLLIAKPGTIPARPDGHSLIEVRRPVLDKNVIGSNRWNKIVKHELGPREGRFIGNPADLETILELAQERIALYKDPLLSDKDKGWRKDKLTPDSKLWKQMERFGVDVYNRPMTKGEASRIYAFKEALNYLKRRGVVD